MVPVPEELFLSVELVNFVLNLAPFQFYNIFLQWNGLGLRYKYNIQTEKK